MGHDEKANPHCEEQIRLAERELATFMAAVEKQFGPEEARSSAEHWIEESQRTGVFARCAVEGWRIVTIAASRRLAKRVSARIAVPVITPFFENAYEGSANTIL